MFNHLFSQTISMPFRKKLIAKIWISALLVLMGIITIFLMSANTALVFSDTPTGREFSFTTGFYMGMGGGLIGAGLITIIKSILLLKNTAKFKQAEIADGDERMRFIINKTFTWTTYLCLFAALIATIVAGLYNFVVFTTLLWVLGAFGLILFLCYLVVKARY